MRANKIILVISIFTALFSLLLGLVIRMCWSNCECELLNYCISLLDSLFAGALGGIITPLTYYYVTKRQTEIAFFNICHSKITLLIDIANWYNENYQKLREFNMPGVCRTEGEEVAYDIFCGKVKFGCQVIMKYADSDWDRFYDLIDDYCGLFRNNNKIKNQMFLIRDELARFSYHQFKNETFRLKMQKTNSSMFEGRIWLRDVLSVYAEKTQILDDAIERTSEIITTFVKMAKLKQYTAKVQGNKNRPKRGSK